MSATRLILVGGFLGAGKTSLLWQAAQRLTAVGHRVGLVTNDQAPELVDTALLARHGVRVAEVAGSCFCCDYDGLIAALAGLRTDANADVLIAEPVGSCTDLSATIIQPIKATLQGDLVVAPLSVLVDPSRLRDILDGGTAGLHRSAAYIWRKQLEEADIVVISKADLLRDDERQALVARVQDQNPAATVHALSASSGWGFDAWLHDVTTREDAGRTVLAIDYDTYAEGEAVLGWLNAHMLLQGGDGDWLALARRFLEALGERFDTASAAVGHVKLALSSGDAFLSGNLTGTSDTLHLSGTCQPTSQADLIINARVELAPGELELIVREALRMAGGTTVSSLPLQWRCIVPGRPVPTHRYDHVVP